MGSSVTTRLQDRASTRKVLLESMLLPFQTILYRRVYLMSGDYLVEFYKMEQDYTLRMIPQQLTEQVDDNIFKVEPMEGTIRKARTQFVEQGAPIFDLFLYTPDTELYTVSRILEE